VIVITTCNLNVRMFCDVCGMGYEDGLLTCRSKYCPRCGKELLKWITDALQKKQRPHQGRLEFRSSETENSQTSSRDDESEHTASISLKSSPTPESPFLSLDIKAYNLPPPFPVPSHNNQTFSRRLISKVLGGNPQKIYPMSGDRKTPMYACLRRDQNPTVPNFQGSNGILITKPIPSDLVISLHLKEFDDSQPTISSYL
jgi:hypothetical protein